MIDGKSIFRLKTHEKTSVARQNLESLKRHDIRLRTTPFKDTLTVLDVHNALLFCLSAPRWRGSHVLYSYAPRWHVYIHIYVYINMCMCVCKADILRVTAGDQGDRTRILERQAFNVTSMEASSKHSIKDLPYRQLARPDITGTISRVLNTSYCRGCRLLVRVWRSHQPRLGSARM